MSRIDTIAALIGEIDAGSPAGFALALHIRFTAPRYLFQAYPRRWLDHYSAHGFVINDPTVAWGMSNTGHIRWSELTPIDRLGVLEQAKDFGLMNGITFATVSSGSRSIASCARADRDYEIEEIASLEAAFLELHRLTGEIDPEAEEEQKALEELSIRLTR